MDKSRIYTWAPVEVRDAAGDGGDGGDPDGQRTIVGVAAVFYDGTPRTEFSPFEGFAERIAPGAFDRAIREDDVYGLLNHDPDLILGRNKAGSLTLSVDGVGLNYEIQPAMTTSVARDAIAWIDRGEITGSSFGFLPRNEDGEQWETEPDGRVVRTLTDTRLFDIAPVTYPAYRATEVSLRSDLGEKLQDYILSVRGRPRYRDLARLRCVQMVTENIRLDEISAG